MRTPLTALQVRAVIMASSLAVPRLVHHAGRQAVMSASVRDDGEVSGLNVLTRLMEEDRDSALEVDSAGVIEDIDPRGSDDELDLGLDAAVIIVGAGAAGVGCAVSLTDTFGLDPSRVLLLERGEAVGTSFRMWPDEMRWISPSFNQAGWTKSFDLNAVAYGSSPAFTLHTQHPSGPQYADYLNELAEMASVRDRVQTRTEVVRVVRRDDGTFDVHVRSAGAEQRIDASNDLAFTRDEFLAFYDADGDKRWDAAEPSATVLRARFVVWAAGEFQYPKESSNAMKGAELCVHNSRVRSWANLPGDDFVIVGGYESGVDAAVNLAKAGKQSTLLASTATWNVQNPDPSAELAPYTADRLRQVTAAGFSPRPKLLSPLRVQRIEAAQGGGYNVIATWKAADRSQLGGQRKPIGRQPSSLDVGDGKLADTSIPAGAEGSELVVHTPHPPVLCTGFEGSVASVARDLFHLADESDKARGCCAGAPLLTGNDESTMVPGVFLVGPSVSHGALSFCFVYKFRQRFGVVANAICRGLGRDTADAVAQCRADGMYLDDFTCCEGACGDAC